MKRIKSFTALICILTILLSISACAPSTPETSIETTPVETVAPTETTAPEETTIPTETTVETTEPTKESEYEIFESVETEETEETTAETAAPTEVTPTAKPTKKPSSKPTTSSKKVTPTKVPSATKKPTAKPTSKPTSAPKPTTKPTATPTKKPTATPVPSKGTAIVKVKVSSTVYVDDESDEVEKKVDYFEIEATTNKWHTKTLSSYKYNGNVIGEKLQKKYGDNLQGYSSKVVEIVKFTN